MTKLSSHAKRMGEIAEHLQSEYNKNLLDFLAKMCHYSQDHIANSDAWSMDEEFRENALQCTSFTVACFLAQNTVFGRDGVDWSIVIEELIEGKPDKYGFVYLCESESP